MLNSHKKKKRKTPVFRCDACSFKCEIESDLNTHMVSANKVHNEELPSVDQIMCDVNNLKTINSLMVMLV